MYTSRIYSYKSAPANIALWPTISSPFREANISSENFWRFFPSLSLDSNTVVENILGQFLSNYESSKARILYIHIYTHTHSNKTSIKERSTFRYRADRSVATTGQRRCFHHGWRIFARRRLITANRIQISGQSGPRRSTRFVSQIIRRVSDRISRETSGKWVSCKVSVRPDSWAAGFSIHWKLQLIPVRRYTSVNLSSPFLINDRDVKRLG